MQQLKERILRDGKCFEGGILKVDNFINHQMDPILMKSMAVEFVRRFASRDINKILTIEASGIAPAIMVGYLLELPVVFAKKKKPSTMENMLVTKVFSFTKNNTYDVCVCKDYLQPGDKVLFIDDFLANGNAAKGVMVWCVSLEPNFPAWVSSSRRPSSMAVIICVHKAFMWSRWR